jgi:hypothetical protein
MLFSYLDNSDHLKQIIIDDNMAEALLLLSVPTKSKYF